MSKQTIGIEISNYGPLKLKNNKLYDAYDNEYCSVNETEYYKKCNYRDYDYYATMTDNQENALYNLLTYLCETHNIPKQFKEHPDEIFNNADEAKSFSGIYFHTSVRKDKYDWPEFMLSNLMNKFIEPVIENTISEPVKEPEPIIEKNIEPKIETVVKSITETKIEPNKEQQKQINKKQSSNLFDMILNLISSLFK